MDGYLAQTELFCSTDDRIQLTCKMMTINQIASPMCSLFTLKQLIKTIDIGNNQNRIKRSKLKCLHRWRLELLEARHGESFKIHS